MTQILRCFAEDGVRVLSICSFATGLLGQTALGATSSSSALHPISELRVTGNSTPKGASTPVFGTYANEEDPWSTLEEPVPEDINVNNPRRVQSNMAAEFNYRAQIWSCLREGDDPWQAD